MKFLIVEHTIISKAEYIPSFGTGLIEHIKGKKGSVFYSSCSAWNLLYKTLRENGLQIGEVVFTESGKPHFKNSFILFSLSHSHDICAIAISDAPVGVDVEIVKSSYNPYLIERSLCENEKAVFDGDFTRLWSRKEAVAKMTGEGITGYPNYIDTTRYEFYEEQIEFAGQKYWLVVTARKK